jgi:hypothetical protein
VQRYELATPPHRGSDLLTLLVAVQTHPPEPLSNDTPKLLADLVMRLLRKEASSRPQASAEVAAELEGISGSLDGAGAQP